MLNANRVNLIRCCVVCAQVPDFGPESFRIHRLTIKMPQFSCSLVNLRGTDTVLKKTTLSNLFARF